MKTTDDILNRLRAEFLEMPGLRLTSAQVQRLCGIERTVCQRVLDLLVDVKFLSVKSGGVYARLTDGDLSCITRSRRHAIIERSLGTKGVSVMKVRP